MTRIKKTRKSGSLGIKKKDVPKKAKVERHPAGRKRKGLKTGSKYSLASDNKKTQEVVVDQDTRLGSKKPIDLHATTATTKADNTASKTPQVNLNKVKDESAQREAWLKELDQLEQDQDLLDLLDRYDADDELSAQELARLNKKSKRHAFLIEKLGLYQEEDKVQDEADPLQALMDDTADWESDLK
ncbi:GTPase-activating protein [Catenovulum sp. SM1970]|uniref:Der GTPase-activating protein YihI n=1 Tax=Marinifaba aquimaris TaxID=2741323 RepID=UPI001571A72C|nr:Der GTPase-activating protein YihI [Marinifaba aquimaris]NTS78666.1 GTPase-activating protein [Marinifaba aquimaris]